MDCIPVARTILVSGLIVLALTALTVCPAPAQPAGSLLLGDSAGSKTAATSAAPVSSGPRLLLLAAPGEQAASAAAPAATPEAGPVVDGATLDPAHTSATFWIRHIVAPVAGRFNAVSGEVSVPAGNPAKGRVTFAVQTASVDTGVAARDTHLRTAEFFDAAAFPAMTFAGSRIVPAGKGRVNVTGLLTIKDVAKTVTIPVRLLGVKPHPMMPCVDVTGYEAVFAINRLEYHVGTGKYFKMGAVGDATDIQISGETLAARPGCVKPQ
jgi:polyisoprenoid-binding protein YceI